MSDDQKTPGWYPDPLRRNENRYWDGVKWTAWVSNGGVTTGDPVEPDRATAPKDSTASPGVDSDGANGHEPNVEAASGSEGRIEMAGEPGWLADPNGEHELRYWDGQVWTSHVSSHGVLGNAPTDSGHQSSSAEVRPSVDSMSTGTGRAGRLFKVGLPVAAVLLIAGVGLSGLGDADSGSDLTADEIALEACKHWHAALDGGSRGRGPSIGTGGMAAELFAGADLADEAAALDPGYRQFAIAMRSVAKGLDNGMPAGSAFPIGDRGNVMKPTCEALEG